MKPLAKRAAAALPEDREAASRVLGAQLAGEWPGPDLVGVLRRHAETADADAAFGIWIMIERSSASVVGDIGFHGPPSETGTVEIGYAVVPTRRGRGYATEAAVALIGWARSQPRVQVIVAGCDPRNVPSVRTLERVGFYRTGEANGELRWRHGSPPDP